MCTASTFVLALAVLYIHHNDLPMDRNLNTNDDATVLLRLLLQLPSCRYDDADALLPDRPQGRVQTDNAAAGLSS